MTALLGTAGFAFTDWEGVAYPKNCPASERLSHYASTGLGVVESEPAALTDAVIEKAPKELLFSLQLPDADRADLAAWERSLRRLEPLRRSGRIVAVLARFPASFRPGPAALDRLKAFADSTDGLPAAAEVRSADWEDADLGGLAPAAFDGPPHPSLLPLRRAGGGRVAYFRFHGRNPHGFELPGPERHDYLYGAEELARLAESVRHGLDSPRPVVAVFANTRRGQAFRNALQLAERLELPVGPGTTPLSQPDLFG